MHENLYYLEGWAIQIMTKLQVQFKILSYYHVLGK